VSNRQRALQRHVEAQTRDEQVPSVRSIRSKEARVGDQPRPPQAVGLKQAPRYADVGNETMTPELILMYRARIASGVYDAPASIHALAEVLLASFDL
jgi:hypothetical protein